MPQFEGVVKAVLFLADCFSIKDCRATLAMTLKGLCFHISKAASGENGQNDVVLSGGKGIAILA
ncbi:hypothetical protein GWR56_09030 [Mucilaginibacter sp. 14171R-50]|uniref:hypothetical protein n=1 Tax=Mucilaginibacter sp. 14171R-50 TaxID=2703789 RepID=UPI00138C26B1|nr:hypothetical protein [Mucilaginibacter sp. 14171R-50]QHS55643.1 hypothetical protein GWR56_08865 [Mucilaginibacter sp. 14171R-50]QHS55674.1 hypothetical protein GWR56_09030 [Mucilaginibacter sp. 14171R-50]